MQRWFDSRIFLNRLLWNRLEVGFFSFRSNIKLSIGHFHVLENHNVIWRIDINEKKANKLHATGDLFATQIEPEPASEDPTEWATMAEASEDERGEQAASPLAHSYCRPPPSAWISLTRTWMSLTTLRGRCFAICCHSTSWWLDHRHPRSRLLSGTRVESMGSKSPLRQRAVCTRLKSSIRIANLLAERTAEARSIVRSWEGISCSAAVSLPGFPVLV